MSAQITNPKKQFNQNFAHNFPAMLQYIRSTRPRHEVHPNFRKPVRKIAYSYAMTSGNLPTVDNLQIIYLHLLNKRKKDQVENFFWSKAAKQKRANKRAAKQKRIETEGRKGLGKFVHKIGKGVVNAKLLILAPLMNTMKKALAKKGVASPKGEPIRDVVSKFLRFVVKEEDSRFFPAQAVMELDSLPDDGTENLAIGPIIAVVVQAVQAFLSNLEKKKAEEQKLSKIEEEILVGAEQAARQLDEFKRDEVDESIGSFLRKNGVMILGGIILIAFLFKRG